MRLIKGDKVKDILFINGLSCGDGSEGDFFSQLQRIAGKDYIIHRPDLAKIDRSSTKSAIKGITSQFSHLENPIVIGFSLGGLWAMFLAREGFTNRVIALSPAMPSNFMQIDLLRLKIFGKSLLFGSPFKFTYENARDYLMVGVPEDIIREYSTHFREEPASLIREYARMGGYIGFSTKEIDHLRKNVSGLILTGVMDRMCLASQQTELSVLLNFEQLKLDCGHTPHLSHENIRVLVFSAIERFMRTENFCYAQPLDLVG